MTQRWTSLLVGAISPVGAVFPVGAVSRPRLFTLCALLLLSPLANTAEVIDVFEFDTVADEARYRALAAEFRCPKCLNTNLSGSDAPIAADLRREVARLVREGVSDQDIRDHLQARYGDFVLYDPPLRMDTLILWLGPALLIVVGLGVIVLVVRRRAPRGVTLSDDERARIASLTKDAER